MTRDAKLSPALIWHVPIHPDNPDQSECSIHWAEITACPGRSAAGFCPEKLPA